MHNAVHDMLEKYQCRTQDDYRNALKEIIQEIALLGLYRCGFFDQAAFYGGTALRIFHGLDRFSEDLDFSLLTPDSDFNIGAYQKSLEEELESFGFIVTFDRKKKKIRSPIESAFIKTGALTNFISIGLRADLTEGITGNELLKIKLEVDTDPPGAAEYEIKYHLNPIPYHVRVFTLPSMFAGKVHALLCRNWGGGRIKGRDLFDYVWYLSRDVGVNLDHLKARMSQTGHLRQGKELNTDEVKRMLAEKFSKIDYDQARRDVRPFIRDPAGSAIWSESFFLGITADRLHGMN